MQDMKFEFLTTEEKPTLNIRYYKSSGQHKGIIVFVHGVSHGAWCWINFVKFFTKIGYACFAINLRGHGDNNKNDIKGAKLSDYTMDVIRCIEYIENNHNNPKIDIPYSKPFIIGHSMGGAIVEKYISDFNHKVKGAVLLAPATTAGMGIKRIITTSFSLRGLRTCPTTLFGKKLFLPKSNFFAVKINGKCKTRVSNEVLEYCKISLCRESLKAMLGLCKFKLNKNINIPVFVIGSDKDAYFPIKSLSKTADFYNTKPKILNGLCHDVMLDEKGWEESANAILKFMENNK